MAHVPRRENETVVEYAARLGVVLDLTPKSKEESEIAAMPDRKHGTNWTYHKYGCRGPMCKQAMQEARAKERERYQDRQLIEEVEPW
jgi:hypothetical protein